MAELVKCKTCDKEVSKTAPTCPHCGENLPGLHVKCPKCSSMSISTSQKGFGKKKAAAGFILFGPIGLLGGMLGGKKVELVCQRWGHKWKADPKDFS